MSGGIEMWAESLACIDSNTMIQLITPFRFKNLKGVLDSVIAYQILFLNRRYCVEIEYSNDILTFKYLKQLTAGGAFGKPSDFPV
jgi:hypothetical protein